MVIRGLPIDISTKSIGDDLTKMGNRVLNTGELVSQKTRDLLMKLPKDQKAIYEVTRFQSLVNKVTSHKERITPRQCYRCQRYGRVQRNYNLPGRFVKRLENHRALQCTLQYIRAENCGVKGHLASFRGWCIAPTVKGE